MAYATSEDLPDTVELPDRIDEWLDLASEIVQDATLFAVYDVDAYGMPTGAAANVAFTAATVAQVMAWIDGGVDPMAGGLSVSGGVVSSKSTPSTGSISYDTSQAAAVTGARTAVVNGIAPRAARILRLAGLTPMIGGCGSW